MNVALLQPESIQRYGEFVAVHCDGKSYTNAERLEFAGRLATVLLAHGVKPGDRVVVMMPNSPDVTSAFHAIWQIGAVIVPVPPQLTVPEVRYIIASSGAELVVTCPKLVDTIRQATDRRMLVIGGGGTDDIAPELAAASSLRTIRDCGDDELALLLYTSGTTGNPKGVMLSHANLLSNARATATVHHLKPQTMSLHVLPLSHSFGVLCMNLDALHGCRSVILPRFETQKVFAAIQEYRVQWFAAVPTMFSYLIHAPERTQYDCSSLEFASSGGAALLEEIRREFEQLFGIPILPGYGLSEAAPTVSAIGDQDGPRRASCGRPIPGVEVQIMDDAGTPLPVGREGEVCVRGPNVMKGYWNDPEATRAVLRDGWLRTGDVGKLDADGYLYITDRLKDLIIKGGENISPRQIEDVLIAHPAVAEVAVIGIPDQTLGEDMIAVIVCRRDHTASEAEILEHAGRTLSKFKVPTRIVFRNELPKNGVGKILKRELRREMSGKVN